MQAKELLRQEHPSVLQEIIETESLGSGKKKGTRKNAIVDLQTDMNRKKADKEETEKKGYEDDGEEKVEKVDKPKKEKKLKNEKRVKVGAEVQGDSSDPKHETSEPIEEPVHVTAKKKKRKREMEDVEVTTADAGAEPSPEEGVESMEAPQQSVKKRKPRSEKGELRRKLRAEALAVRVAAGEEVEADKQEGEINERGGQGPATSERTIKARPTKNYLVSHLLLCPLFLLGIG